MKMGWVPLDETGVIKERGPKVFGVPKRIQWRSWTYFIEK